MTSRTIKNSSIDPFNLNKQQNLPEYNARDYGVRVNVEIDNAPALNDLISLVSNSNGGRIILPAGIITVGSSIILRNNVHIWGNGWNANQIRLLANSDCDVIKTYVSPDGIENNAFFCGLYNLQINGNRDNQTPGTFNHGINATTNPISTKATNDIDFDPTHIFFNVRIMQCSGHGYFQAGRSGNRLIAMWSQNNNGRGFHLSFDTELIGCHAQGNVLSGFFLGNSSTLVADSKSYNNGQVRNSLTNQVVPTGSPWQGDTAYTQGDLISYDGDTFICLQDHTSASATLPSNLTNFYQRGAILSTTAAYKWQGVQEGSWAYWYKDQTYNPRDIVFWANDIYMAKQQVTSNTVPSLDTTNWQKFVASGTHQATGDTAADYGCGFYLHGGNSGSLGKARALFGCNAQQNAADGYVAFRVTGSFISGLNDFTPCTNGLNVIDSSNINRYSALNIQGATGCNFTVSSANMNPSGYVLRQVFGAGQTPTQNNINISSDGSQSETRSPDTFGLTYSPSSFNYIVHNGSLFSDMFTNRALGVQQTFYGSAGFLTRLAGGVSNTIPSNNTQWQVGDIVTDRTGDILICTSQTGSSQTWTKISPKSYLPSKGSLISASAPNQISSLSAGLNSQILSADSSTTTGLKWTNNVSAEYLGNTHGSQIYTVPRFAIGSQQSMTSGNIYFTFFTAPFDITISNIFYHSGGTASSGLTLCRFGLYTFDGTTATLVARTNSDTTIFNATFTLNSRSLSTTGGYPSNYSLIAGQRYATAVIQVGSTPANLYATPATGGWMESTPIIAGMKTSQTDLLTTTTTPFTGNAFAIASKLN
jgi:hypothetical protein